MAVSDFMITANKCLLLHYMWLDVGYLFVYLVDEDLSKELIALHSNKNATLATHTWSTLFIALPTKKSLQRVVIVGARHYDGASGIIVDDMSIRPCSDFSKYPINQSIDQSFNQSQG